MTKDNQISAELLIHVPQPLYSVVENFWHDWCNSCEAKEINPDQGLPLSLLGKTWACSDFVARNCIRYPEIFSGLLADGFESTRTIEHYRKMVSQVVTSNSDDNSLMSALRILRQQEMMRIAWRDLNLLADLDVIFQELEDGFKFIVVVGVDINQSKIDLINSGKTPIIEEGMEDLVSRVVERKKLVATFDAKKAIAETDITACGRSQGGASNQAI